MDFVQNIKKPFLFQGTRPEDAEAMLKCLEAREKAVSERRNHLLCGR